MAKPNYAFQKRQRELAKKQKKEAKKQQREAAAQAQQQPDTPEGEDGGVPEAGKDDDEGAPAP